MTAHKDAARLMDLVFGFIPAQVVHTVATLDLADRLADEPASLEELARLTNCHEPSLRRLLRGAVHLGLLVVNEEGSYELTSSGQLLRADVPCSVKYLAREMGGEPTWSACGRIEHTVRTGQPAVEHVFGRSSYAWMADNPSAEASLYAWVLETARRDAPAFVAALDVADARDMVDVGGGNGILTAGLLAVNPGLTGTIFDRAAGLENARAVLEEAGISDRCSLVVGDFLTDPLPAGRDVYVVKGVLSDWVDDDAVRVLQACHRAMRADSRLFLIDLIMPALDTTSDPVAVMSDLCTLACGGAIRTEKEFRDLLAAAGLRLEEVSGNQAETGASILHVVKN
ncbi:methyltransferase [Kutzneria sp. CA-103260]|uniref:methyltransferase n=1 Tax=Kutzneria sp. CA-103260 TaxID=2802641 RepID=UPI001BABFD4C|nr:methyltransferase [Kutzneria sp. CA-103260]QUQ65268.1 methyltransferase [Kutzneria sp. CA-103260]